MLSARPAEAGQGHAEPGQVFLYEGAGWAGGGDGRRRAAAGNRGARGRASPWPPGSTWPATGKSWAASLDPWRARDAGGAARVLRLGPPPANIDGGRVYLPPVAADE